MPLRNIETEWEVFAGEGEAAFGAVREIHSDYLVVWIENHGDASIDARHVTHAHDGKVIVSIADMPTALRVAIQQAHDAESVPIEIDDM